LSQRTLPDLLTSETFIPTVISDDEIAEFVRLATYAIDLTYRDVKHLMAP